MNNRLLIFTALAEGFTGVILFAYPPIIVRLLFGQEIAGTGLILGRLAGLGLIALAVACLPRGQSRGAFDGMLAWSVLAALYLIVVGIGGTSGILLWPMVVIHGILAVLLVRARAVLRTSRTT